MDRIYMCAWCGREFEYKEDRDIHERACSGSGGRI